MQLRWEMWLNQPVYMDALEFMSAIPDNTIDAIITDPPFAFAGAVSNGRDSETSGQFFEFWWKAIAKEIDRVIKPTGSGFIHTDWRTVAIMANGFNLPRQERCNILRAVQVLYWDRQMIGQGRPFRNQVEMILFIRGGKFNDSHIPKNTPTLLSSYWYYGKHKYHPAEKSEIVTEQLIRWALPGDGIILDPFAGSFTTAVVANRLGKQWLACDHNLDYVENAKARLGTYITADLFQFI